MQKLASNEYAEQVRHEGYMILMGFFNAIEGLLLPDVGFLDGGAPRFVLQAFELPVVPKK